MSSMGKAMMGTGEAEGEKRADVATDMALNNPLIDEYSLKGAKGLLVNITGGEDLTLFEVDQAVKKITDEVDPEVELIFGAIQDEKMEGKMRVSIVATSLDGHKPESKTILNMVSRIQNRNPGYSDNIFKNPNIEQNPLNSIDGATVLKLDEQLEVDTSSSNTSAISSEKEIIDDVKSTHNTSHQNISLENASYIENNLEIKNKIDNSTNDEDSAPKLFSEENNYRVEDEELPNDKLFDQVIQMKKSLKYQLFKKAKILVLIVIDNGITPKITGRQTPSSDDQRGFKICNPNNGGNFMDCTFGAGGYSKEFLKFNKTKVVALDRDYQTIKIADQLKKNFNLDSYL